MTSWSGAKVPILVTVLNLAPTYDIMSGAKVPILVTALNLRCVRTANPDWHRSGLKPD